MINLNCINLIVHKFIWRYYLSLFNDILVRVQNDINIKAFKLNSLKAFC